MSSAVIFRSKIDTWLLIVLTCAVVACLYGATETVKRTEEIGVALSGLIIGLLTIGAVLPTWILLMTRYRLGDEVLDVRSGPFSWSVPIVDITNVEATRDPKSSPALSLDRLRISYGADRELMISPEPREQFLRSLESRRGG